MNEQTIDRTRLPIRRAVFPGVMRRTLAGGVIAKFTEHHSETSAGDWMDNALPRASGGVTAAIYDSEGGYGVDEALANAVKRSVAQLDGTSAKELKAGLAKAQAGTGS